ncbi:MAG: hypothetical protein JXR44_01255 [Thiotrichales bacterium]|nr:hypothetical protein [Thiotrichales bacterium]
MADLHLPIQLSSIQPQQQGFVLLTLISPMQAPDLAPFWFADFRLDVHPEIEWRLFALQAQVNGSQWQLLGQPNANLDWSAVRFLSAQAVTKWSEPNPEQPLLLVAEGLKIAPILPLAKLRQKSQASTLVLLHSDAGFAFAIKPARFLVNTAPPEAIGASALLEDWKIANRLSSQNFIAGCAQMTAVEMLGYWLQAQSAQIGTAALANWQVRLAVSPQTALSCQALLQNAGLAAKIY